MTEERAHSQSQRAFLCLHYFAVFSAIGAYNPFFPSWLRTRGIDGFAMSALVSLNPLLGVVSPVVFGVIADRSGFRGSLLRVAALGALVPFAILTALAVTGGHVVYGVLFALVALFAFFRSPLVTIADVTALEESASYAQVRRFGSAGFAVASIVAGLAVNLNVGWQLPAFIAAALIVTLGVTFGIHEGAARSRVPIAREVLLLLRSRDFALLLAAVFLWNSAHASIDLCYSLRLRDLGGSSGDVGMAWCLGVVAEIALMSVAPRLFASRPAPRLLAVGAVVTAVRLALLATVRDREVLVLLQPLHAVTFGLTWISGLELVKERAPSHVLATAQSSFAVSAALGSAGGTLAWGTLYAKHGGEAVFGAAACVAALASLIAMAMARSSSSYGALKRLAR